MRAGSLRHRVTIQRYELVVDEYGAPLRRESWKDVATVWASVDAVSGREFFAPHQVQADFAAGAVRSDAQGPDPLPARRGGGHADCARR